MQVLFLCTGNSCRSQMAEGLCRDRHGDSMEVYSTGIEKHGLNPLAVRAMAEIDIDISGHESKTLDDLGDLASDELRELLPDSDIDEDQANTIIMAARAHWFDDEDDASGEETDAEPQA